jgi:hypothetical protein
MANRAERVIVQKQEREAVTAAQRIDKASEND